MKKTIAALLISFLLITFVTSGLACSADNANMYAFQAYTLSNSNMRSGPDIKFGVITVIPKRSEVTVLSQHGDWYFIKYNGKEGYVRSDLISQGTEDSYVGDYDVTYEGITSTRVNFREGPGTEYRSIKCLAKGTTVEVIGTNLDWKKVMLNGHIGYIKADYLRYEFISYNSGESTTRVHFRSEPSTASKSLEVLPKGTVLEILAKNGSWYTVLYHSVIGYVHADYVK